MPSSKWEAHNVGLACSHAMKGYAYGVAIACGKDTDVGRMAELSFQKRPTTRVAKHLRQFSYYMILVVVVCITTIFYTISFNAVQMGLQVSLSLLLALMPLFLPPLLWWGLWYTKNRMLKRQCLVQNLHTASTVGLTTVIVSDNIGTLTRRQMRVTEIFVNMVLVSSDEPNIDDMGDPFDELIKALILCNDAYVTPGQIGVPKLKRLLYGNMFDMTLLRYGMQFISDIDKLRRDYEKVASKLYPDSERLHVTVHKVVDEDGQPKLILLMKGHCDVVLRRCSSIIVDDQELQLDTVMYDIISNLSDSLVESGRHVRAFAYRDIDREVEVRRFSLIHGGARDTDSRYRDYMAVDTFNLRFLGMVAAHYPPRSTIRNAVSRCRTAGIKIVIVTSQRPENAKALAIDVGILGETMSVFHSDPRMTIIDTSTDIVDMMEFVGLKPNHQKWQMEQLLLSQRDLVCANCTVDQHYMIVDACNRMGAVVSVIGYSLHHTPVLQRANVGVAKFGGAITCDAGADAILRDGSFASLVGVISLSRLLFENMKKAMAYSLSTNMTFLLVHFSFFLIKLPFWIRVMSVFIIQFIVNLIPAASLILEYAEEHLMMQKPKVYDDYLVNRRLLFVTHILVGPIEAAAVFILYFKYMAHRGFIPKSLYGLNYRWYDPSVDDIIDTYGQEWNYASRMKLDNQVGIVVLTCLIMMQSFNLLLSKTARANVLTHGFDNMALNVAFLFLIGLIIFFNTVELPDFFCLAQIDSWLMFFFWTIWPFATLLIVIEASRRYFLRMFPESWLATLTNY
ncbi:sodium/potassium-transporting ATPase subunit alpha [Drosophila bipectinata]|uniref:sodium/potassium-transporting ATPase subunit alpha n=1 Tax=Drosophila bipectinata TaxID=42026 RepID=UPI0007E688EA|nr:sodium/potassium-transporting ATPase subunit alpha [Drosophila bipectinata]